MGVKILSHCITLVVLLILRVKTKLALQALILLNSKLQNITNVEYYWHCDYNIPICIL